MLACMIRSINVQKTTLRGGEEQRDTELGSSLQCPNYLCLGVYFSGFLDFVVRLIDMDTPVAK